MQCLLSLKRASRPAADAEDAAQEQQTEPEANFELSGKLAAETNTVNGVVLVYQEPPEGRKPTKRWRLYVFKGGECGC